MLILFLILFLIGSGLTLRIGTAPEGWQDETGFHFGRNCRSGGEGLAEAGGRVSKAGRTFFEEEDEEEEDSNRGAR